MADDRENMLDLLKPWIDRYKVTLPNPIYLPAELAKAIEKFPPDFALSEQEKKRDLEQVHVWVSNLLCLEAIYQKNTELFLKAKEADQDEFLLDQELKAIRELNPNIETWQQQMLQLQEQLAVSIQAHMAELQVLLDQHKQLFSTIEELHEEIVEMHSQVQQLHTLVKHHQGTVAGLVQERDLVIEHIASQDTRLNALNQQLLAVKQDETAQFDTLKQQIVQIKQDRDAFADKSKKLDCQVVEHEQEIGKYQSEVLKCIVKMQGVQESLQTTSGNWQRLGKKVTQASSAVKMFALTLPHQKREALENTLNSAEQDIAVKLPTLADILRRNGEMMKANAALLLELGRDLELESSSDETAGVSSKGTIISSLPPSPLLPSKGTDAPDPNRNKVDGPLEKSQPKLLKP